MTSAAIADAAGRCRYRDMESRARHCAVRLAADLVQDQVVHVQLRVAVAAGVLAERRDHPLARVLPPSARVVAGPGLTGLALQVVQGGSIALHDRVPDLVGYALPAAGLVVSAGPGSGGGVGEGTGMEQRDGLGHAEGRIPVQVRVPDLGLRLDQELLAALGRRVRLGREELGVDLLGGPVLARRPAQRVSPDGSRGSTWWPYSGSNTSRSTIPPWTRPSSATPLPVQMPGGSPPRSAGDK